MNRFKFLAVLAVTGVCFAFTAPKAEAQVTINIGPEPECPYGYYDYAPYGCAPYGYYGPEWFSGGVFVGAGPWYHGAEHFQGHVDTHYDVQRGYKGPVPKVGEKPEPSKHPEQVANFKGDEVHDGHARGGPAHGAKD
jgi:hypothetical protein